MSARDPRSFLAAFLRDHGYAHEVAEELVQKALDKHAHELAEKQRESARAAYSRTIATKGVEWAGAWVLGHDRAADLIDPEAQR